VKYLALFAVCLVAVSTASAQKNKKDADKSAKAPDKSAAGPKRSKGEIAAINAMLMSQTPDDRIRTADELITKFADTDFKAFALYQEADAYEMKSNHDKAIVFAEQAVAADPKSYDALILIANVTASQTKDTDLDMAEKLSRSEKAANDGMETLKTISKPTLFQLTDAQWDNNRKISESQGWQALGTIATVRKKPDEAIADFEKALALNPDPVLMLRAGRALIVAKKYDDAIGWFEKAEAAPDSTAQIKSIATADKARASVMKAQGAK
jgi:tetratricopeptide (TPR) repeat protein